MALRGDEGRGKLRKAVVRGTHSLTHRYPNGATHPLKTDTMPSAWSKPGELKHLSTPRRRKQLVIPQVVASERGTAQTSDACIIGVIGLQHGLIQYRRTVWEGRP